MSNVDFIDDNSFIKYNSLITISVVSEDWENPNFAKYLLTEENIEQTLKFKLCKKPLIEYSDLKETYFFIRNIDECILNFGISKNEDEKQKKKSKKKEEITNKELGFSSREKINQSSQFYLQHMNSKKFVSLERTLDNTFALKLLKNIDNAAIFSLSKINVKRNTKDFLTIKDIYYLRIYIQEDDQFLFIQDNKNAIYQNNNEYYNILIKKNPIARFLLIDQMWNIKNMKSLYSGQLLNIIFSYEIGNKEEQFMLCAEKREKEKDNEKNNEKYNKKENESKNSNIIEEDDEEEKDNKSNIYYRVNRQPFKDELYHHVINNSFWVIEEDVKALNCINKQPIKIGQYIKIKNVNTGLYLTLKKKRYFNKNNSESKDNSSSLLEDKKYEFDLVDGNILDDKLYFDFNFLFYNYMLDDSNSDIIDEGKYILKGVFRKLKFTNMLHLGDYYQSISLIMKKNYLLIQNDEDFIFKIKKVDLFKGFEVNYIKKIIAILNEEIKKNNLKNNNIINENILFFLEYLLNINFSFRDEKYEYNVPIEERQILLYNFDIIDTVANLIDNYLNKINEEDGFFEENKEMMYELLDNIFNLLKYLSFNNEEIKQAIYIIILNKLLILAEMIYDNDNVVILIDFIFDLIEDSEALQDYLLEGGGLLKRQILKNPKLSCNINDLLRVKKLLQYIERNYNYLLSYEKLIGLNKVQYKRKEIILLVKNHIEEVKNKNNNKSEINLTYKVMIENVIEEIIELIKKHAILLERFKKNEIKKNNNEENSYDSNKKETELSRRKTLKESLNNKKNLNKRNRMNTILGNNYPILDSPKINSLRPLRESDKNISKNSININNINNDNNNKI